MAKGNPSSRVRHVTRESRNLWRRNHLVYEVGEIAQPDNGCIPGPVATRDAWYFDCARHDQRGSDRRSCLNFSLFHLWFPSRGQSTPTCPQYRGVKPFGSIHTFISPGYPANGYQSRPANRRRGRGSQKPHRTAQQFLQANKRDLVRLSLAVRYPGYRWHSSTIPTSVKAKKG